MKIAGVIVFIGLSMCLQAQQLGVDEEGCKDSTLLPRIAHCSIMQCSTKEADPIEIQVGALLEGTVPKKTLEGPSEVIYYLCPSTVSLASIVKQSEAALKEKGYKVLFSGTDHEDYPLVSAQNGQQWMQVSTYTYNDNIAYIQTAVKAPDPDLELPDNWQEEFEKNGRAPVYGISFDPGKATLTADSEKTLEELAEWLKKNPAVGIKIEGHTDNSGSKEMNMTISQARAAAVQAWLVAHGIPKQRLGAQGFGDTHPLGANDSDEGRARNRRIELAKL